MFVDSHCHLDKLDFSSGDTLSRVLTSAAERQVSKMLCVSVDMQSFTPMYEQIAGLDQVYASVGVHPLNTAETPVSVDELLAKTELPKIIALGETGLDYFYQQDTVEIQQQSFINHLDAAKVCKLPVIVHTRDARQDTLDILRHHADFEVGGVLHCFTESWDMGRQALDMNYLLSFSGIITFKNAAELREVVKQTPLDKMLIETDSPYLAPVPYRGKQNEPAYVAEVAQCIADIKGLRAEDVARITTDNFHRLFNRAAD
ncbi:TatD family hydrolase [Aliamphritea hakodatensis]|uniref:TatD family hydrolase n=1 Tax=Aliamphritea hakodatensis TaxID=2895352 RepID=UPI0022FD46A8|nr:TatD family hydrolase [Aliamphritea hakodatensis]